MKKGFTLMEILIVISLLVLIAIVVLITLNPWGQINKSNDSKRKHELTQLSKTFEDYYNDKSCYPKPSEVCYNDTGSTTCNICGNETVPTDFSKISPYLTKLPCDPHQPTKKYLYQTDNNTCPTWFRIYTTLSNKSDPAITEVGCSSGCGPSPDFSYNYGITSPNTNLETSNNFCSLAPHLYTNPFCQICDGSYSFCKSKGKPLYTDPGTCINACVID